MYTKIQKLSLSLSKTNVAVAYILATCLALLFAPAASAATRTYALACTGKGNHVVISGNKVSCKKSPAVVTVQGVGSAAGSQDAGHPYPDDVELTIVTVDCGNNTTRDPQLGGPAKDFCSSTKLSGPGVPAVSVAPKSIKLAKVTPNPRPAAKNPSNPSYGVNSNGQTVQGGNVVTGVGTQSNSSGAIKSTPDPAACAANPHIPGCNADASAVCTSSNCDIVIKYVNPAINMLSIAFGLIAVISIMLGAIQYSASGGDPQKVTEAKKRITMTLMAIAAYVFVYTFLQFLIPGGLFHHVT